MSKYVLRVERPPHLEPVELRHRRDAGAGGRHGGGLSIQWGNTLLPMVVVWCFGAVILWTVGRLHITLTYVASFLVFAVLRAARHRASVR